MNYIVDKETLNNFCDDYIKPTLKSHRTDLYPLCFQRCKEIISTYRSAFPLDCAQLDLLFILLKQQLITPIGGLVAMDEVIEYMYDHFDEIYKAPKIFISHSEKDKPIVEKFVYA